jgi:HSP20 family protein
MANLTIRRPSGSVWDFMREVERLFDTNNLPTESRTEWFEPRVDVKETNENYIVKADLPGISPEQIKVEAHQGRLTISGERSKEVVKDEEHVHRVERFFGRFERSFQLPQDANDDQIQAKFEKGVLEVVIPKSAKAKPKTIAIEAKH